MIIAGSAKSPLLNAVRTKVLVRILYADQSIFKYINIDFEELPATLSYIKETAYSASLLNANGIILKNYFVSWSKEETLSGGSC